MNLEFWRDIRHLTMTVGLRVQKSPRHSLIPPFQVPWYLAMIAGLGVCPNETIPLMHRQFGLHPPLSCQHFPLATFKLTLPSRQNVKKQHET
jgi:hypothetical protein